MIEFNTVFETDEIAFQKIEYKVKDLKNQYVGTISEYKILYKGTSSYNIPSYSWANDLNRWIENTIGRN